MHINNLHLTVSEPPTSIISVWNAVRCASGSSIPVNVAFDPTNVDDITTSMIACEKGMGNSLGGVKHSWSSVSRLPGWLRNPRRNSSLVRCNSLFLACKAARSSWMHSCSALDTAIASWRPCIIPITCCKVKASFRAGAVALCLVFLILGYFLKNLGQFCWILGLSSVNLSKPWGFLMNSSRILTNLHELLELSLNLLLPSVGQMF